MPLPSLAKASLGSDLPGNLSDSQRGPVSESLGAADQPGLLLEGSPNRPAFAVWRAARAAGDSSSWVSWSVFTGAGSLSTFKSASGCPVEVFGVLDSASLCSFVDTEVGPGKTGWLSTGKAVIPFVTRVCGVYRQWFVGCGRRCEPAEFWPVSKC
jgi:hypothetical protein